MIDGYQVRSGTNLTWSGATLALRQKVFPLLRNDLSDHLSALIYPSHPAIKSESQTLGHFLFWVVFHRAVYVPHLHTGQCIQAFTPLTRALLLTC